MLVRQVSSFRHAQDGVRFRTSTRATFNVGSETSTPGRNRTLR